MPRLKMISPETVKKIISQKFSEYKASLLHDLSTAQYVCCTADIWSTKHKSYMGVTVHWVDINTLERRSKLLCCRRFLSPHDNTRIMEILSNIYQEFGIAHKVIGTVTDNASNFSKAFKIWGISIEEFEVINKSVNDFNDLFSSILEREEEEGKFD